MSPTDPALSIPFDNSYARLPDRFFARLAPTPVAQPGLIAVNDALARDLGLDPAALRSEAGVALLAGNGVPDGAEPLAMAYAGHQFGGWSPQLGDGRAILWGEVIDSHGNRRDIQLKGSGRTPFSRGGDGRAWVGPVLREYLVSEAMARLGVPTTRALAAVTTGDTVVRERAYPGAVLARVAASHIRVGTFQYFVARDDVEALQALTDHVIARHYPNAAQAPTPALALLGAVVEVQARLIARWMGLGFVHGVMNTDNTSIAGETIDYGPCAFLDTYHPDTVFSSIDHGGRYAYGNQPRLANWNLAQFASSLVPLIAPDREDAGIAKAQAAIDAFPAAYDAAWLAEFRAKLALLTDPAAEDADRALIVALLQSMAADEADFAQTFRALSEGDTGALGPATAAWLPSWEARIPDLPAARAQMRAKNPAVIARTHQIERVIQAAVDGDLAPFKAMSAALADPYQAPADSPWRAAPDLAEKVTQTFCGT